ncbi:carbon starvation CstA family protein [Marivirga harenae]|uniref:carbon starvation CstA family protein n=1 Tax=Marivirga harenae TaxID=2010992 RepID=UPI0026DF9DAF|nr:carbon starvation protein A [Marivirga harenae]WKV13013.1 carbon starvation protein A [Marivirga harenae]
MSLPLLLILSAIVLISAYFTYGRFISKKFDIKNDHETPAHTQKDGVDYVPSNKLVVLGHHFASIAGAGPIVGPIIAVTFGWIPAVIWILVGGIFIGAVHDVGSMVASLRHKGKSIGVIIHQYIGRSGKRLFLIFSFSTLILIIAVFADIIAKTFVKNPGVASTSTFFIILALAFGFFNRKLAQKKYAFAWLSIVGVILMYYFVVLGNSIPFELNYIFWVVLLLAYAFVASVTPMSVLLQPRDYLSSFLLYGLILLALVGVFVANPEVKMDSNIIFKSEDIGYLFPVLFITVACGAISGFHSLVASGTTSKQLNRETDAKVVGYGGMLIESFLAIISVCAVMVISRTDYASSLAIDGPVNMFADGMGYVISSLGIEEGLAVNFVALTISAFALTTLDTCTRLARFTFQEFFEETESKNVHRITQNRFLSTFVVVILSSIFLLSGEFTTLWPIFGSANQLLAALALLAVSVWLIKSGKKAGFLLIPMFFMFVVTLSSLFVLAFQNFENGIYSISIISGLLFVLAIVLLVLAKRCLKTEDEALKA